MFNKNFFRCAAVICAMTVGMSMAFADPREVEADGEYRLGDNDTRAQAKDLALDDAKKSALEKVAVFIESYSLVNDFQLTKQQIASYTNGKLQIKSKTFDFIEDGLVCKAHIIASVEIDENELKNLPKIDTEPIPDPNPIPPPPLPVIEEYNGHFYRVVDEGMDWRDADEYCRNLGGHLVTINSSAEQKFVQGLIFGQGKRNCYWLGAYQHHMHGDKWYWVDGAPFDYTNWADGQPDNTNETGLMMYRNPNPLSNSSLGEWNDLAQNGTYASETFFGLNNIGFVCEWESRDQVQYS